MGTSVSHPSPKTTNWKPVQAGYIYENIPVDRIISDIWRAVENDPQPLSRTVESDVLFRCQQAVQNSSNIPQAIQNVTAEITRSGQNSIVAEFAKRAVPAAFKAEQPAREWRAAFFSELTNYLVSRDVSGYVGEKFRNKSVSDLVNFKQTVKNQVTDLVRQVTREPANAEEWRAFVRDAISSIRGGR